MVKPIFGKQTGSTAGSRSQSSSRWGKSSKPIKPGGKAGKVGTRLSAYRAQRAGARDVKGKIQSASSSSGVGAAAGGKGGKRMRVPLRAGASRARRPSLAGGKGGKNVPWWKRWWAGSGGGKAPRNSSVASKAKTRTSRVSKITKPRGKMWTKGKTSGTKQLVKPRQQGGVVTGKGGLKNARKSKRVAESVAEGDGTPVIPVVVAVGPQLAAGIVARHNDERQRMQRRNIAWDAAMARTAKERLNGLLYSLCSSKEDPQVPGMGLLTAVAEKSYLVNTFVEMGFHPPKQFALDAVDSWLQGKKDFQGFKKTCYTFGCAAYANINTGMVERMGCSTVRAASVSQGCFYEYCRAAGSHAF